VLEDAANRVVDALEDGRRDLSTDGRRERVRPRVGPPDRPEEPEAEQRQRDESDQRLEGDRGRVGEQAVVDDGPGEQAAELARLLGAAPGDNRPIPGPAWPETKPLLGSPAKASRDLKEE